MVQGGFKDDSLRGFLKAEWVFSKLLSNWRTWRSPKYCVLLLFLTVFRPRPPERGPGPSQWGAPWILMNVWRYILRFPSRPLTILRLLYWHNELEMVLVIGTGAPALSDSHSLSMWCLENGGDTGKTCVSISISALQTTQGCVTSSHAQLSLLLRDKVHLSLICTPGRYTLSNPKRNPIFIKFEELSSFLSKTIIFAESWH